MAEVHRGDARRGFVRLKVKDGARGEWANIPVEAPSYLDGMRQESDRERGRIAAARAEQKQKMAVAGRKERTDAERQAVRPAPGVWVAECPTIIHKRDGRWLHLPFEKRTPIAGKAEDRRLAEPDRKVGTIDRNGDSGAVAAWEGPHG